MGDRYEIDLIRTERQVAAEGNYLYTDDIFETRFLELVFDEMRGEGRGIERAAQLRPEMGDGADMIFMRVGQHDGTHVFALFGKVADIGHDEIDAGRGALAAEHHAAIDDDPIAIIGRTIAIGVEIHPDLARAAERQEDEFIVAQNRHQLVFLALRAWIMMRPRMVRSGSR